MTALYHIVSLFGYLVFLYLTASVYIAKLLRVFLGAALILLKQKIYRDYRVAYPSRRVYSRSYTEADKSRGYLSLFSDCLSVFGCRACRLYKRRKSCSFGVLKKPQSHTHYKPVLIGYRHNVGYRAYRREVRVLSANSAHAVKHRLSAHSAERHLVSANELEYDTNTGKITKGILAVRSVRIHHRYRRRKLGSALVVIGNDHVHAKTFGINDLVVGGDTRVHRNDKRYSCLSKSVYRRR